MPNRKTHSIVGGTSGGIFYLIDLYVENKDFHFGHCLVATLGGEMGSRSRSGGQAGI